MKLFAKTYEVKPNTIGYLYNNNKLEKVLEPGFHDIYDWKGRMSLITLPTTSKLMTVANQEVLTKDNVALRFSYYFMYRISDGKKFLEAVTYNTNTLFMISEMEVRLISMVQLLVRDKISAYESEDLNEKRLELNDLKSEELSDKAAELGISIDLIHVKDLTFPKSIQDLFAKHLEAKIRAKSDLENARTAVATARALKNASELMKGDENLKFIHLMETLTKISEKGKHTFTIGDLKNWM